MRSQNPNCRVRARGRRGGFSFAEVMFAVVVLGIGFIMIAAIFPVAIQQSKATSDEATCAAAAAGAVNLVGDMLQDATGAPPHASDVPALWPMPPSGAFPNGTRIQGQVYSICDPQPDNTASVFPPLNGQASPWQADQTWEKLRGSLIFSGDSRYGYVLLYRRDKTVSATNDWSPYVQLYVITTQVRNRSVYSADPNSNSFDVVPPPSVAKMPANMTFNLQARPVKVYVDDDKFGAQNVGVDLIRFDRTITKNNANLYAQAAAEGAYVIIARDNITTPAQDQNRMNGRVYRLGTRREDLDSTYSNQIVFELQPGNDFSPDPGADGIFGSANNNNAWKDDILGLGNTTAITVNGSQSQVKCSGPADAWIVGRNPVYDGSGNITGFEGPAQDISLYTTFVQVR